MDQAGRGRRAGVEHQHAGSDLAKDALGERRIGDVAGRDADAEPALNLGERQGSRATMVTLALRATSASTMPSPIPTAPPVTTTR